LLANGVDVKTVQTRLGHANPSITLGWYAHAIPENDHDAADMFGSLFSKPMSRQSDSMSRRSENDETADDEIFSMSRPCPAEGQFQARKRRPAIGTQSRLVF